jgi:tetratricopeptide (TPR) repeat protein
VVEDLHWIDSISQEFLNYLIDWLAGTHILLILLYRPEYTHQWGSKSFYSKIGVDQLTTKSSAQLVQNILEGAEVVPGSIQRKDHQYVLTREASDIEVPDTIQGIIAARMDRIEESLKRIMQVASVIGREFAYRILQTIMGMREELKSSLINLQGLELIYEKSLFPELEYIFKHALTQEVAYNSLLQKRRKEIHEKIGNAIEKLYPERLEEYYELLAHHYTLSNNKEKALAYLDLANQKATRLNAMEEAKADFEQAMKLLDSLPETKANQERRITLLANQWMVFELLFQLPEYYDHLTRHEPTAVGLENQGVIGAYYVGVGLCQWWLGDFDAAIQTETKAKEICEVSGTIENTGFAYNMLQWCHVPKGNFDLVLSYKEDVLRMMEQRFSLRWYVWAFCATIWAYIAFGRYEEALEDGNEALRVADEFSDNSLISFAAWHISMAYHWKGDPVQAVKYAELAVRKAPTPADKIWAQGMLGFAGCRAGQLSQGIENLVKAVSVSGAQRFRWGEVGYRVCLGEGYYLAGEYEKASQTLKESLNLAERLGMQWFIGVAHSLLGQAILKTDPTRAAYHFEKSIASLQKTNADPTLIEFLRGILMLTRGNLRQGVKIVEDLSEVFLEKGSIWHYVEVEYMLGKIYLQMVIGAGPKTFTFLAKNIAFLIQSFPRASEKAEYHLIKAIETAKEIGAKLILGQAYHDLGLLHKAKKRSKKAKACISEAIQVFKQCKAEVYLKQANEALESLL